MKQVQKRESSQNIKCAVTMEIIVLNQSLEFLMSCGYLTIIPWVRIGYEMVDSQQGVKRQIGYNHLMSNKREWNNCFIKNAHKISRILPDFICKNQPIFSLFLILSGRRQFELTFGEHGIMAHIPWYNLAKPIRALELHYLMIQFLIKIIISLILFICSGENVEDAFLETAKKIYQNIQDGRYRLTAEV